MDEFNRERYWEKVHKDRKSGCWVWIGALNTGGYGLFRYEGKMRLAHRVGYELKNGSLPEGMVIDHTCRVRHCVNPKHLQAVTQRENIRRSRLSARDHFESVADLNATDYVEKASKAMGLVAAAVLSLAALTAPALGADANAPATHAQPTPASIAPGGNITSVVQETAAHGWPHRITANEAADVTNLALWYATTTANVRTRTSVRCYFGSTLRGAYCGIRYTRGGRQTGAFRMDAKVFEDGSYSFRRR